MSTGATTGIPVRHSIAFLFKPVKNPFMPRLAPRERDTPNTFGEDIAVKMSQRTLFLILLSTVAAALAWANLKSDASKNHDAIQDLVAVRLSDLAERKADRDVMMQVKQTVDNLQRRAEWQDRREGRTVSTTHSNP